MSSTPKSEAPKTPDALRFTGDGGLFVRGIPPRDLTSEDLGGLGPINVQRALMSGLYETVAKTVAATINQAAEATDPTIVEGDGAPVVDATAGKAT